MTTKEYREDYYRRFTAPIPGTKNFANRGPSCLVLRTHSEVAAIMGISRQAVHQLERRALWKLQRAFREWMATEKFKS